MKYRDAVAKCRELGQKAEDHASTAMRASRTYTAVMELFNVAAEAGDEKAMQEHRDALHTCVDTILDSGAMVAQLRKEQLAVANSVTDYPQSF